MKRIFFYKVMKTMIFMAIACGLFGYISMITLGFDDPNYQQSTGFLEEPEDTLDAVYIGASPTFTSWIAPFAWGKYGITMRTFSNTSQPIEAVKSFLELSRRKQPHAVYLISINSIVERENMPIATLHATTDYFPNTIEKLSLFNTLCGYYCDNFAERFEIFFPLVRFHSKWSMLSDTSFHGVFENYKGAYIEERTFTSTDISDRYCSTTDRQALPPQTYEFLQDLLSYCENEEVRVVFVLTPQYRNENSLKQYNTMTDEIKKRGFPIVNEFDDIEKIGLDLRKDFFDNLHANFHGALKITDYLSQYLIENYGFDDKRENPAYSSWNEAFEAYSNVVDSYLTESERDWITSKTTDIFQ